MAKIGTAHIEVKPVVNEEALAAITDRIAEAVTEGVRRGMECAPATVVNVHTTGEAHTAEEVAREVTSRIPGRKAWA